MKPNVLRPDPQRNTDEELARLKKATRIANYLQVTTAEDLLAVGLENNGAVLRSLDDDWWRNVAFHAGAYWRRAPSETTRALVVKLMVARRRAELDPADVDFRGCADVGAGGRSG